MPRAIVILALAAALAGCGGSKPDAVSRASWHATARFVVEQWRRDAVPSRYAADTLRVAGDELHDRDLTATADAVERGDRTGATRLP